MQLHLYTHTLVEPILSFIRMQRFTGPEQVKRYYRLFGDLEYQLLSARAHTAAMRMRLREAKRWLSRQTPIDELKEEQIALRSDDLVDGHFQKAMRLQRSISASRNFRYNALREQQSFYILSDIALAIMGIEDCAIRSRERETLNIACEAYGRLDLSALIDVHDSVQQFLSLQRRDRLDDHEEQEWRQKLESLRRTHPICCLKWLEDSVQVTRRIAMLKKRIAREERELQWLTVAYRAAVDVSRQVN
jgi:hypothetical protein